MNAHSFDDVENRSTGSMLSMLDGQRQHRRLRSWVRCLDKVAEGAHVWPASALLIVGTLVMAVAWLCHMSVHSFSSTYLALKTETHLHDVITTIQQERRCSATCLTPSSPSVNVTTDICHRTTDVTLTAAATNLPADVIDRARRDVRRARDACSDVAVTSCSACWRRYGDVVTRLVTWGRSEPAYQLHEVWTIVDRYKQQLLSGVLQRQYTQCDQQDVAAKDLLSEAWSAYWTVTSRRSAETAVMYVIVTLLLTACPAACVYYSVRCTRLINLLNQYTHSLNIQTQELKADAERSRQLLHRLLPAFIADDLKHDKAVLAESYRSVTIYFSDIVGFTAISASSTPMQVVEFLNKLYTEFDSRIDLYDVYKVETVGDAYMIVSGCPRTNGFRHAGELATLALDLLNMTHHFKIPHQPDAKLMLRIGLHSGPCVAAVVGERMPRYCLFGDTVGIASRMESTGQALRIQVSEQCKDLLDQLGTYEFDDRGQVEVKENVYIKTHWLTGKDGYRFTAEKDVCVYVPKKVKLERVIVMKTPQKVDGRQEINVAI